MQFFENKIDPIFRSQVFVTNDQIEIPLRDDLVAFKFIYDIQKTINQLESQTNQTYIVPMATIGYQNNTNYDTVNLNIIKCSNPDLLDYYCVDFSTLSQKNLIVNTNQRLFSVISIFFYSCRVTDNIKTLVPDNCAQQSDIDNMINGQYTLLHLRLFTQQYNTTSKQNQINFKNYMIFPQSSQYILNTQNIQNQITKVRDGFIIQSESEYSAPIQYIFENQSFPNDDNPYIQINLQIDEVIQYTSIQFSTFPQILALVNSAFSLLMLLGFFCRRFANKSILQDFFCIFLQNMHQNLYEEVLKQNKLFEQKTNSTQIETKLNKLHIGQEISEKEVANIFNIPQFITKSRDYVEQSQQTQLNNTQLNQQDEILQIEEEEEKKSPKVADQFYDLDEQQQQENKEQRNNNQNQLKKEQIIDKISNNILFTTETNEIIKNSNDSGQNIFKTSPRIQFSQNRNESYQNCRDRPLSEISKIPQSASIFKNEIQRQSSIFQKDNTLCFTERQMQQPTLIEQDEQKLTNCQVTTIQASNTNQTSKKNSTIIEYYIQKLKTIQDINIFKRFTEINFGYRFTLQKINCFKKKTNQEDQQKFSNESKIFIEKQVLKSMNILELLKDVIFIKKSIMLLMSRDQLAAMKLVGYSENYIQDHYLKKEAGKQKRETTYLEQQLDIYDSTDLSSEYIKKFIQKCNNSKILDKLDKRILSSINKNKQKLF
ncbi:hypothetical protein TTHERM_00758910 (macronuclear) [Tetrahymena thermophila SB210]|uniref:AMP-binding enzyme family protein n=1 Tax=Tetrahymena thermophila (strain SB210) TaxID=312017 RepID=Q23JL4_TETTS|nr:hypothetical protein TTHERM_00758910 [Tetrahymena thermophila SB210]EAR96729.2 hypothetical protein TTHERM_00758910 [Tetrahymena thermophila SB210]|eukprot:XP_001016974.2 hypothetical protein TTHERM_00758910 [Tetrahymena thermophila SB210]